MILAANVIVVILAALAGCVQPAFGRWTNDSTGGVAGNNRLEGTNVGFGLVQLQEGRASGGMAAADHCIDQHLRVERARDGRVSVANPVGECDNAVQYRIPQSQGYMPYYGYGGYGTPSYYYGGGPYEYWWNGRLYNAQTGQPIQGGGGR